MLTLNDGGGRRRRRRRQPAAVTKPTLSRVLFLPITDAAGGAHLVSEDAAVAGRQVGRYAALCGAMVLAGSLTAPEQNYCRRCTNLRETVDAFR